MVRCLAIGDPHFKTKNKREMELMVQKSIELAKQLKPDFIVDLGDTLDTHEKIHVVPLTQSISWIEELSKIAPTYVIIGNHDRPNNSDFLSDLHPYNGLKGKTNIIIVDDVMTETIYDLKFMFVPYVPPGKFIEAISSVEDLDNINEYATIFSHQEFFGAKMGAIVSSVGDKWPLTYPFVTSGHIHDYQRPQENILYTGTPLQHAFGDSTRKTVSYLNITSSNDDNINSDTYSEDITESEDSLSYNNKIKSINCNNYRISEERIDLGLPKKRIFRLNVMEVLNWQPPTNSLIKLIIKGTNAELKATMKLSLIKEWEKSGIKIDTKTVDDGSSIVDGGYDETLLQNDKLSYLELLKKEIDHDSTMEKWFNKLFSSSE